MRSVFYKSIIPAILTGAVASWGIRYVKDKQQQKLLSVLEKEKNDHKKIKEDNNILQKENNTLYTENMKFHRLWFNKRLMEKWLTLYSPLWEIEPYTYKQLNDNIMKWFISNMNSEHELLLWMYSAEYEYYKTRQWIEWQSMVYYENQKNDFYTLQVSYDGEQRDIRKDILALIADINFKVAIKEYYHDSISFLELFAVARTILANLKEPFYRYDAAQKTEIMNTIIQHRIQSWKNIVVWPDHVLITMIGKSNQFASTQKIIDYYNTITPRDHRSTLLFRDSDFADYRSDRLTIYDNIQNTVVTAKKDKRPYSLIFANHGGISIDKNTGFTVLIDSKGILNITPNEIISLLKNSYNTDKWISNIQLLHCYANNSWLPLIELLNTSWIYDNNLPIIIMKSDSYETSFGTPNDTTPYSGNLKFPNNIQWLSLQAYYQAQIKTLGYNASSYVPYTQGLSQQERKKLQPILKYKKYIQQY